jgi:phosphatidylinositol alpha-1,6-mannosyltransferase
MSPTATLSMKRHSDRAATSAESLDSPGLTASVRAGRAWSDLASPIVAAVTLATEGGGIAAVSRMTWRVCAEAWPASTLVTLSHARRAAPERPALSSQLRFGTDVLRRQFSGAERWLFFNHLALARAQAFVPRSVRRPYVVFLHGIEAWRPLPPATQQVLADAAMLIANSRHTAARTAEANPGLGPIEICPLATDIDVAKRAAPVSASALAPTVLIVGRMLSSERYKGHDQLLEAWPAVIARLPRARLVIAGAGDDLGRLEMKARDLGIRHAIEVTGFVSESQRADLYERAHVFALPSAGEGFGLVYLEAMAHGLPCIGSTVDAAREVITDRGTGYLVDRQDIPMLSARLLELLTDEPRRLAMGASGRAKVAAEFSYRQFSHRLLSLLGGAAEQLGRQGDAA